jgi:hypothetical protein
MQLEFSESRRAAIVRPRISDTSLITKHLFSSTSTTSATHSSNNYNLLNKVEMVRQLRLIAAVFTPNQLESAAPFAQSHITATSNTSAPFHYF